MARPHGSIVRERLVAIIGEFGEDYGYNLHKKYIKKFGACSRELIYYHLRKGVQQKELIIVDAPTERGEFSWGCEVTKKIYGLGEKALVSFDNK